MKFLIDNLPENYNIRFFRAKIRITFSNFEEFFSIKFPNTSIYSYDTDIYDRSKILINFEGDKFEIEKNKGEKLLVDFNCQNSGVVINSSHKKYFLAFQQIQPCLTKTLSDVFVESSEISIELNKPIFTNISKEFDLKIYIEDISNIVIPTVKNCSNSSVVHDIEQDNNSDNLYSLLEYKRIFSEGNFILNNKDISPFDLRQVNLKQFIDIESIKHSYDLQDLFFYDDCNNSNECDYTEQESVLEYYY